MNLRFILSALVLFAAPLAAEPVLRLHDGKEWKELQPEAWQKLPRREQAGKARDGQTRTYSGVAIGEILKFLNAPAGSALRGPFMNSVVLLTAADGYQVAFSLAELDPGFRDNPALLAESVDHADLSDHEGPLMLVVPGDARHSRWIRQVKQIALLQVQPPASP